MSFSDQRLAGAGTTPLQVQAVWIKQATREPSRPFPAEAKKLQAYLAETLQVLAGRYRNLKIAYLSSRIYAGYAMSPLNPEPHAYETGFAVKWLIEEQIAGNPELNYDAAVGKVRAPWLAWGPYLWADGLKLGRSGLTYSREEFAEDGTHPSAAGRRKVGELLLRFLRTDPTAKPWFLGPENQS